MAVTVTPMTPHIGADVSDVDLSTLDDAGFAAIKQAFLDHQVLFFRDQDISMDAPMEFGRRFGTLHVHPASADYRDHGNLRRSSRSMRMRKRSVRPDDK